MQIKSKLGLVFGWILTVGSAWAALWLLRAVDPHYGFAAAFTGLFLAITGLALMNSALGQKFE